MAAAVVRVKRRINEEPLNAFILNCKRCKTENHADVHNSSANNSVIRENLLETKDEVSTILKFAGTVQSQDENIASQITKLSKDDARRQLALKTRKPNILEKSRKEMRQMVQDSRFKVVNCFRTTQNENADDVDGNTEITVVDIEKQTETVAAAADTVIETNTNNLSQLQQESTSSEACAFTAAPNPSLQNLDDYYVYDLYLPAETNDQQNMNIDYNDTTYLSVRPFDDLVYEDRCNDDGNSSLESEDSNAEDYWKNEYPDTDDSINDSDMRRAIGNYNYDEEHDLSSDDEDHYEGFVHSINSEEGDFENDIDNCDVDRYGVAYARYKARVLRMKDEDDDDDDDD